MKKFSKIALVSALFLAACNAAPTPTSPTDSGAMSSSSEAAMSSSEAAVVPADAMSSSAAMEKDDGMMEGSKK